MNYIYGSIGYTILQKNKKKIIILSDMHDVLNPCNKKEIIISEWLEKKIKKNKSKILLEEVPNDHNNLQLLWTESIHTKKLKELYLNYSNLIMGVDIRPLLIPFSLEVINNTNNINDENINFYNYLNLIDKFFSLLFTELQNFNFYKIEYLKKTLVGNHFIIIKNNYKKFLLKYKDILYDNIKNKINNKIIEEFNDILNDIMEWYTCACIFEYTNNTIIIHIGLYHAEKITHLLTTIYNFDVILKHGINHIADTDTIIEHEGCVPITNNLDNEL